MSRTCAIHSTFPVVTVNTPLKFKGVLYKDLLLETRCVKC